MISTNRRRLAALMLALALAVLALGAPAGAAVRFTHESYAAFQAQLSGGKIHAVTFNKKAHTVHISLNDGRHMLAVYPPSNEPAIAAQLTAKGVPFKIEKAKKAAPVHHKLRYIAAGVLVVLIVIVVVVLAVNRRRPAEGAVPGEPAPLDGPPAA